MKRQFLEKVVKSGFERGKEERFWERQRRTVLREAKKNGLEKGKKDVAKKMKQENIDLELIIKVTGLSKEQIEDLWYLAILLFDNFFWNFGILLNKKLWFIPANVNILWNLKIKYWQLNKKGIYF